MRKAVALAVVVVLIIAGLVWIYWGRDDLAPDGPELVLIDAEYQHPIVRLSVTPEQAAQALEIAVQPKAQLSVKRIEGLIEITLEEWEYDQEYVLSASLPDAQDLVLDLPFEYRFRTPQELAFDLTAVGDVMLDQLTTARIRDYDVNYPLAKIRHITGAGDLNFANLECPISERGEPADKFYVFRAPPYSAEVLEIGGFNLVSLANNHVLDYGPEALQDTVEILEEKGISFAGAWANEERARQGAIVEVNGVKVALLAYTRPAPNWQYPVWAAAAEKPGTVFFRDREKMLEDLARVRDEADIVLVSMHWGNEYTYAVTDQQKELARLLVDNGADGVLGHHPHAPQGIEFYRGKPIIYSLGNFLFYPFGMEITDETFILKARFGLEGVEEMRLVPVLLGDSQPFVPEGSELTRMHEVLGELLNQFGTSYEVQGEELLIAVPED